jgi:hypothetical protein
MDEVKHCSGCKADLPLEYFTARKSGARTGQPVSKCKKCRRSIQFGYRLRDKSIYERVEWPSKMRRNYGIEPADYYKMLDEQGGGCAICGSKTPGYKGKKKFAVDHCHATGAVRGVLCHPCNKALGLFKDEPEIMVKAAAYIKKSRQEA